VITSPPRPRPLAALTRVELLMFLREPFAVFFTLVLPVALQLIFAAAFGHYETAGVPVSSLQLTGITLMVSSYLGLMGVPIVMAEYRQMGVLRAFRIVPIRLRHFIAAHVTVEVMMFLAAMLATAVATAAVFGLTLPRHPLQFVVLAASGLASFLALGFAIASLGSSPRTSQAIGAFMYFGSLFTSGASIPRDQLPEGLRSVFDRLPASMLLDQLQHAWTGVANWSAVGAAVVAMTAITALSTLLAIKRFDTSVASSA
jgi:ABC-2 type transport system permease protein